MQEYFTDEPLEVGGNYFFTKQQVHHVKDVLRMNNERIRLVSQGKGYFATVLSKDGQIYAHVYEEDSCVNELPVRVTLAMALIRREKFELVLQKAAELGVCRIVPFVSSRCVVQMKDDKKERQKARWEAIVQEAAEQCKRNFIPEVCDITTLKNLENFRSEINAACYENAYGTSQFLSQIYRNQKSITVVIGPEGGFSNEEVNLLNEMEFPSVTLGNRILRAETAAMYSCSVIAERASLL